jgi:hypothetical protein
MKSAVIALGLAALAGQALAADQFDLKCSGTRQMELNGPTEALSYGFRVDLAAKRWCWDHCERTYAIEDIGPDRIAFADSSTDEPRRRETVINEVSRVTGDHRQTWIQVRPMPTFMETKGHCEVAPFSGFPAALF